MIETHTIESVLERQHALNFMGLDHASEQIAHDVRLLALDNISAADKIGHGEICAEIVGRMTPLSRKPCIVEVEPPNERADIERGRDGIEFVICPRDAAAVGHDSS